ncbi:MAG TPA: SpoIIE family protein phosphatase [Clostridiales bacterium]|nr:SpoIIE family protein phosphatase [Clostridiales bacterium]
MKYLKNKSRGKLKLSEETLSVIKTVLKQSLMAAGAFTLAQASIFGRLSPFAVALVSGVHISYLPAALLGSAAGYVMSGEISAAIRYIAALVIAALLYNTFIKIWGYRKSRLFSVIASFAAIFSTGLVLSFAETLTASLLLLFLSEAIVAGGSSYFIKRSLSIRLNRKALSSMSSQDMISLLFSFGILLLSLQWLTVGGISLARMAASFAIIAAARYGREAAGSITGISAGATLSIADGMSYLAGGYSLGGLLAGVFGIFGRVPAALSFVAANIIAALVSGSGELALTAFIETGFAAIVFCLLPSSAAESIELLFSQKSAVPVTDGIKNVLNSKINMVANVVAELSTNIKAVGNVAAKMAMPDINKVYIRVQDKVCRGCERKSYCWESGYNDTMNAFNDMTLILKKGDSVSRDNMPRHFAESCLKRDMIAKSFNATFYEYAARSGAESRVLAVRDAAAQQYSVLSMVLNDISRELSSDFSLDNESAEIVRGALENFGITVTNILSIIDKSGHLQISFNSLPPKAPINKREMAEYLGEELGIPFELPITEVLPSGEVRVRLYERPPYKALLSASQYTSSGNTYSGDAYQSFYDGTGNFIVVLSDGMGTGKRAALDGNMSAGLAAKLMAAGFEADCTLKIVNAAMLLKSRDESISTLDIAKINLYTGETTIFKAGAAPSYARRKGKTVKLEKSSLPLGIIQDMEFEKLSIKLYEGDILTLMSDGAADCPQEIIKEELMKAVGAGIADFSESLAKRAYKCAENKHKDDITVIGIALVRNKGFETALDNNSVAV